MNRSTPLTCALTALFAVCGTSRISVATTDLANPPLETFSEELIADAADGSWDGFTLLEAALAAEGLPPCRDRQRLTQDFGVWKRELQRRVAPLPDPQRRAVAVLDLLHQRILTGRYVAGCHRMSRTIRQGDFNCITATIAYLELARSIDLPVTAIQAPGHVHVRLEIDAELDIESTCPTWKRPALPAAAKAEVASRAAPVPSAVPPGRILSDVALVGKVYYNRGIELLEKGRFPESVAATRTALRLDPDDAAAANNLLAAYNNWALDLCERHRYADAAALIVFAHHINPAYPPLAANDLHVHQKWVLDLCERGQFAEALNVLERGYRRRPEAELFDEGRSAVRRWWAESADTLPASTLEID